VTLPSLPFVLVVVLRLRLSLFLLFRFFFEVVRGGATALQLVFHQQGRD
jgi:hypothetical protein